MSFGYSSPKASLQVSQGFRRSPVWEERGVNLLRGMRARTADHHPFTILFPLED
jgi:hypothetical protein